VTAAAALFALLAGAAAALTAPGTVPPDRFPGAAPSYIVAIDGDVRWQRAADTPRAPASLTKILSAIVLLERDWDPGRVITVSPRAASLEGTRLRLRAGEQLRAGDALTAMLVASSNDACLALAEDAAGSVEAFVQRLNDRAVELGLTGTRYANPCGLPQPGHVTTARDLLRMADLAMAMPEFASRARLASAEFSTLAGRHLAIRTTNMLIGRVDGVVGVKTGYTRVAGKCLVALAERDGTRVAVVLLAAPDRWWTAAALIEEAFHVARPPP
jgi:D-alanyl-D-alanine carboxypeptidase (penicillin-binding protein 5/6)